MASGIIITLNHNTLKLDHSNCAKLDTLWLTCAAVVMYPTTVYY